VLRWEISEKAFLATFQGAVNEARMYVQKPYKLPESE